MLVADLFSKFGYKMEAYNHSIFNLNQKILKKISIRKDGWLRGFMQNASPNFDARPAEIKPFLLVIHNISLPPGEFGGSDIVHLFKNCLDHSQHPFYHHLIDLKVSAHFLIQRVGRINQFVSCNDCAWHAGQSDFLGKTHCNHFSIGIELEGTDFEKFERKQYVALSKLINCLCQIYPIKAIVGHSDIAPSRKTDPGPYFNWRQLQKMTHLPNCFFPYGFTPRPESTK